MLTGKSKKAPEGLGLGLVCMHVLDTVVYLFHIPPFPPEAQCHVHKGGGGRPSGPTGPSWRERDSHHPKDPDW